MLAFVKLALLCTLGALQRYHVQVTCDTLITNFEWSTLWQTLPSNHTEGVAAIYNGNLFVIGGSNSGDSAQISSISLNNLNTDTSSVSNSDWSQSEWYFNDSINVFSLNPLSGHEIKYQFASVQIDSKLYLMLHDYFVLLVYDLKVCFVNFYVFPCFCHISVTVCNLSLTQCYN